MLTVLEEEEEGLTTSGRIWKNMNWQLTWLKTDITGKCWWRLTGPQLWHKGVDMVSKSTPKVRHVSKYSVRHIRHIMTHNMWLWMHCKTRLNRPPPVSISPANIPQVGHTIGPLVAVDMVQKCQWQSRGAYMAVNRHRSGLYVTVVQA